MTGEFQRSWRIAQRHKIPKSVWVDALELSRRRADDLSSGRMQPNSVELARLQKRRISTFVRYEDSDGATHGFFVGRGATLDMLMESGALEEIVVERGDEAKYKQFRRWTYMHEAFPRDPKSVTIYPMNRTLRTMTRRRSRGTR